MAESSSVVILYVVVGAVYLVYGATRYQTFYMHAGKHCVNKSASLRARSDTVCCRTCLESDTCTMVSFHKVTSRCELSETDIESTGALAAEEEWDVYYKIKCEPGWTAHGDACYLLDASPITQPQSQLFCHDVVPTAHLTDIRSEAERSFLTELMQQSGVRDVWLNAEQNTSDGLYYWNDGTAFDASSDLWLGDEPSAHLIEHCVVYELGEGGGAGMRDIFCDWTVVNGNSISSLCKQVSQSHSSDDN